MKKIIFITALFFLSNLGFSQSLIVYKTDQTSQTFNLSDVDSITFSVVSLAKSLDVSGWECVTASSLSKVNPASGVYENVSEGLKVYGDDNKLNKIIHLTSVAENPIENKTVYLKWKANGSGDFLAITVNLCEDTVNWASTKQIANLTTSYSSNGSEVISDNVWYYTRFLVTSNSVTSTTAKENYDNYGGTIVQSLSTDLSTSIKSFTFGIEAAKSAYAILGEARIE